MASAAETALTKGGGAGIPVAASAAFSTTRRVIALDEIRFRVGKYIGYPPWIFAGPRRREGPSDQGGIILFQRWLSIVAPRPGASRLLALASAPIARLHSRIWEFPEWIGSSDNGQSMSSPNLRRVHNLEENEGNQRL